MAQTTFEIWSPIILTSIFWIMAIGILAATFAPTSRFGRLWLWGSKRPTFFESTQHGKLTAVLLAISMIASGFYTLTMLLGNLYPSPTDPISCIAGISFGVMISCALIGLYLRFSPD